MDDLGWGRGTNMQLLEQQDLLMMLRELSYSSWFMPITNMETLAKGTEKKDDFTLQLSPGFFVVVETPVDVQHIQRKHLPTDACNILLLDDGDCPSINDISLSQLWLCHWSCQRQSHTGTCNSCCQGQWRGHWCWQYPCCWSYKQPWWLDAQMQPNPFTLIFTIMS